MHWHYIKTIYMGSLILVSKSANETLFFGSMPLYYKCNWIDYDYDYD